MTPEQKIRMHEQILTIDNAVGDQRVYIYRISGKENSFIHDEVCRDCASEFQNKGLSIEIDGHLQKYVYEKDGITYYEDGSDEENPEIECSICGEYLISEDEFLTEGVLNAL